MSEMWLINMIMGKSINLFILNPKAKWKVVEASLRLTATVNSFVVAILTVSRPVAEFIEMNTFFGADALYVIEGASDHNLLRT